MFFLRIWPDSPSLGRTVSSIPAGITSDIDFTPPSISFNGEAIWPDFILAGKGQLAISAVSQQTIDPLVAGIPTSTTTVWSVPSGTQAVSLTIVGTPVPEPTTVLFLATGLGWLGLRRIR